ncbi:MAG: DNA glycosylase, partial [Limisphaerales bacterium]
MKALEQRTSGRIFISAQNYDLAATLISGQAFRWQPRGDSWVGVVGRHCVRLRQTPRGMVAETRDGTQGWDWMLEYLQARVDLDRILDSFPADEPMNRAVDACRGLRILRQEPWECLASFILSATKQIAQIRQIVARLCRCFGEEIPGFDFPAGHFVAPDGNLRPEDPEDSGAL